MIVLSAKAEDTLNQALYLSGGDKDIALQILATWAAGGHDSVSAGYMRRQPSKPVQAKEPPKVAL